MRRDHRQVGEAPFAAFDVEFLGHGKLKQMADGGRQNVVFTLEKVACFGESAQGFGNVGSDRRFLGDDELLGHFYGCWVRNADDQDQERQRILSVPLE